MIEYPLIIPSAISSAVLLITLIAASWQDFKSRSVYQITWYPAAVICSITALCFWIMSFQLDSKSAFMMLMISLVIAGVMILSSIFGIFGKADAKALILISLTVPITPFASYIFPSLAVSSIINAGVIVLIMSVIFFAKNIIKGNKAPLWLMCSGSPVDGKEITKHFGFISEVITEENGVISRKFTKAASSITALKSKTTLFIRELTENPDEYKEQIDLYARAGKVWISYGIPLIIPITIGYVLSLFGISAADIIIGLLI